MTTPPNTSTDEQRHAQEEAELRRYRIPLREQWRIFHRLFRLLRPYKSKVALVVLITLVVAPIAQLGNFLTRNITDDVLLAADVPIAERFSRFVLLMGTQVTFWLLSRLLSFLGDAGRWYLDMRVTYDLRLRFYDHLQRLPLGFFRSRPIGEQMYRAVNDTRGGSDSAVAMVTTTVPILADVLYNAAWAIALLSLIDRTLGLLVFLYLGPYLALSHYLYGRLRRLSFLTRLRQQEETGLLRDSIAGLRTVKSSGRTRRQRRRYMTAVIRARRMEMRGRYLNIVAFNICTWALRWVFDKSIWLYITYRVIHGDLTVGDWAVTLVMVDKFRKPMVNFVNLFQNLRMQMVLGQRLMETLDARPEITDAPDAVSLTRLDGVVAFENVSFEYVPGRPVLQGVSFRVEPGQTAAFVGPSGAGKSTILNLLLRLEDPTGGRVLVDGHDLRRVRLRSYLDRVGMVPQSTYLFDGTLSDAIRYGKPDASDDDVRRAAEEAELGEFVAALPEGYETPLGEGTRLSGGQKQRLGIARALVREPRVLILDEATASLDPRAEDAVLRTLRQVGRGRTVLSVAHRLAAVADADVIFVLDGGRIVEQGTHRELYEAGGLYRRLWDEQAGEHLRIYRAGQADPLLVQHAAPGLRPHLHPLRAPDDRGGTLTEDAPGHHPWQHGLYVGLNDVNGIGFWKEGGTDGTFHPEPLAPPVMEGGTAAAASWSVLTEWRVPNGDAVLREMQAWTLTDSPADSAYTLDLTWSLTPASGAVRFGAHQYGGLFLRMPYRPEIGGVARDSEKRENAAAEQQRARWVAVCLPLPDRDIAAGPCGIALLDHPGNPEHPTPWRVDNQLGVAPSRCIAGEWTLAPGETTTSRYRLLAFVGFIDDARIEAEWQRFAATGKGDNNA